MGPCGDGCLPEVSASALASRWLMHSTISSGSLPLSRVKRANVISILLAFFTSSKATIEAGDDFFEMVDLFSARDAK